MAKLINIPFNEYMTQCRILENDDIPLILLHGGPGSTHNYFELLDPLNEKGHYLLMYDQLGCGTSFLENKPELWHAGTWLSELDNIIDYFKFKRFHLLGQSWGGMLALLYALKYSQTKIASLILSSTLPSAQLWAKEGHRLLRYLNEKERSAILEAEKNNNFSNISYIQAIEHYMYLFCGSIDENSPECLKREKKTGRESYEVAWGKNELMPTGTLKDYDITASLKDIKVPTLIISGSDDLCTAVVAKTLFDGISNSHWELFENCRHMCFADNREYYLSLLDGWLNEHH